MSLLTYFTLLYLLTLPKFSADCLKSKLTSGNEFSVNILFRIPTGLEALFKVCKALFKCVFLGVCCKQSYNCFAFLIMKPLFTPGEWHEVKCVY